MEQLANSARELGLEFVATTEHNTSRAHGLWAAHTGDDLLVILGQEVVTRTGHWLALGVGHLLASRSNAAIRTGYEQVNCMITTYGGPYLAAYEPHLSSSGAYCDRCGGAATCGLTALPSHAG